MLISDNGAEHMPSTITVVAAKVTTRTIHDFADQLGAAIADDPAVTLDVSAVADVDLSFVQLVEAGRRDASEPGRSLRLDRPANPAIAALLRRAGFLTAPTPADIDFWFHGALPQ